MANSPRRVTITGIDEQTEIRRVKSLCKRYPVEFAILCDPARMGHDARVPEPGIVRQATKSLDRAHLAFHLCGTYSDLAKHLDVTDLKRHADFTKVHRLQVNSPDYSAQEILNLQKLHLATGCEIIVQNRARVIPAIRGLFFLDDDSSGRGLTPLKRARPHRNYLHAGAGDLVGYAGGLSPENLTEQLHGINEVNPCVPYWIDVASGVRDKDNFLDLDRVEAFLELAFPELSATRKTKPSPRRERPSK